jgi:small subunit ribosomal protein S20
MAKEKKEEKRAKRPQAQKREIQNEKRRLRNRSFKASIRTAIRGFEEILPKKDDTLIKEKLSQVFSLVDKGVKHGIYKLNKASRTKARLAARAASQA